MKKLVCRKCGGILFKFKQNSLSVQCCKCESLITTMNFNENNNKKVDYLSVSWKNISNPNNLVI